MLLDVCAHYTYMIVSMFLIFVVLTANIIYWNIHTGRAGGACTSTLLKILYADEQVPEDDLSFTEVLDSMRSHLKSKGYSQIPQLR